MEKRKKFAYFTEKHEQEKNKCKFFLPWGEKNRIRRSVSRVLSAREGRDGHSSGTPVAGRLARSTRTAILKTRCGRSGERPCRLYSILLPAGLAVPPALLPARCALTAPFHPCSLRSGLFSVALSLGSPPPGVTRRRVSMEPGLSSATCMVMRQHVAAAIRPSDPRGLWRGGEGMSTRIAMGQDMNNKGTGKEAEHCCRIATQLNQLYTRFVHELCQLWSDLSCFLA